MKVGIIGAGDIGNVHGSKYSQMPDVELHVFDLSPTKTEVFAERHGAVPAASLAALLDAVDVADICTPTDAHVGVALQSIAAGRPTLVEKPMAGSLADCDRMIEAAESAGVPLMPAQVVRFFPEHRRAHELVAAGGVGRPASARLRRGGRAPLGTDGWFMDHDRSGGVLLDLAVHEFDWLLWTLGPVTRVTSRSVNLGRRVKGAEFVGDYALTTLLHEGGAVSHVEATWMDPGGFRATLEVAGSEGVIEWDSRQSPTLRLSTDGTQRSESHIAPHDDPYYRQLRSFLDSIEAGRDLPVSAREGREAVRVALAALESARTLQPVALQ